MALGKTLKLVGVAVALYPHLSWVVPVVFGVGLLASALFVGGYFHYARRPPSNATVSVQPSKLRYPISDTLETAVQAERLPSTTLGRAVVSTLQLCYLRQLQPANRPNTSELFVYSEMPFLKDELDRCLTAFSAYLAARFKTQPNLLGRVATALADALCEHVKRYKDHISNSDIAWEDASHLDEYNTSQVDQVERMSRSKDPAGLAGVPVTGRLSSSGVDLASEKDTAFLGEMFDILWKAFEEDTEKWFKKPVFSSSRILKSLIRSRSIRHVLLPILDHMCMPDAIYSYILQKTEGYLVIKSAASTFFEALDDLFVQFPSPLLGFAKLTKFRATVLHKERYFDIMSKSAKRIHSLVDAKVASFQITSELCRARELAARATQMRDIERSDDIRRYIKRLVSLRSKYEKRVATIAACKPSAGTMGMPSLRQLIENDDSIGLSCFLEFLEQNDDAEAMYGVKFCVAVKGYRNLIWRLSAFEHPTLGEAVGTTSRLQKEASRIYRDFLATTDGEKPPIVVDGDILRDIETLMSDLHPRDDSYLSLYAAEQCVLDDLQSAFVRFQSSEAFIRWQLETNSASAAQVDGTSLVLRIILNHLKDIVYKNICPGAQTTPRVNQQNHDGSGTLQQQSPARTDIISSPTSYLDVQLAPDELLNKKLLQIECLTMLSNSADAQSAEKALLQHAITRLHHELVELATSISQTGSSRSTPAAADHNSSDLDMVIPRSTSAHEWTSEVHDVPFARSMRDVEVEPTPTPKMGTRHGVMNINPISQGTSESLAASLSYVINHIFSLEDNHRVARAVLGGIFGRNITLEEGMEEKLQNIFDEDTIIWWLEKLQSTWENDDKTNIQDTTKTPGTETVRGQAEKKLQLAVPHSAERLLSPVAITQGISRFLAIFQHRDLNRQLAYRVIELLVNLVANEL
ncbi:hypothetical protein BC832DRAFT_595445 [Gaertneriomyces semiglobifer]|nr:hypothetical protein BC832DRAFT_595445 [Gaertneriomyces semiglobifer]